MRKAFGRGPKFLFWKIETNDWNLKFSLKILISWNLSAERIECSFDKTCQKTSSESLNVFIKIGFYPLKPQNYNRSIVFLTKYHQPTCFFGHVVQKFENPARKLIFKCLTSFALSPKNFQIRNHSEKRYSAKCSSEFVGSSFDYPHEFFCQKSDMFSLHFLE